MIHNSLINNKLSSFESVSIGSLFTSDCLNWKVYRKISSYQFIRVKQGNEVGYIYNCYIWGRGENKKLWNATIFSASDINELVDLVNDK